VSGRSYLRDSLGLRQFLTTAALFAGVFLFRHLTLMLVKLKFVYLTLSSNLGSVEVSHLFSAHLSMSSLFTFLAEVYSPQSGPCMARAS
jgi:hypothetical protein